MEIYLWKKWIDVNENRITPISQDDILNIIKTECLGLDKFLFKQIINPNFEVGVFHKSKKKLPRYEKFLKHIDYKQPAYPNRSESLVCTKKVDDMSTETFVVFPYKNSLFTIVKESKVYKGYWKSNIKWLDSDNITELWTDSSCLIINKKVWDKINETLNKI